MSARRARARCARVMDELGFRGRPGSSFRLVFHQPAPRARSGGGSSASRPAKGSPSGRCVVTARRKSASNHHLCATRRSRCIAVDVETARWATLTPTVANTPSDAPFSRLRRRTSLFVRPGDPRRNPQRRVWIKRFFAKEACDCHQLLDKAVFLDFVVEVVCRSCTTLASARVAREDRS